MHQAGGYPTECNTVSIAGLAQGIALVTFRAASTIFGDR